MKKTLLTLFTGFALITTSIGQNLENLLTRTGIYSSWNNTTSSWDIHSKKDLTVSPDTSLIETVFFNYQDGNYIKTSTTRIYGQGTIIRWESPIGYIGFDSIVNYTDPRVVTNKTIYKYDSEGLKTEKIWYFLNNSSYTNYKTTKTEDGYIEVSTTTTPPSTLTTKDSIIYKTDAVGHILQQKEYNWDKTTSSWKPGDFNTTATYDENNNLTETTSDNTKITLTYLNGKLSERIIYKKTNPTDDWMLNSKDTLSYNTEGLLEAELTKKFDGSTYTNTGKEEYTYSIATVLANAKNAIESSKAYPNPANDVLNLEFDKNISGEAKITISNPSGTILLNQNIFISSNSTSIDVNSFESGIYFMEIETPTNIYRQKFIKK